MRSLIPLLAAATALLAAAPATAKTTPPEAAQQARAQQVLGQIQELDARLERTVQAWDGANIRLAALDKQVRTNRVALTKARRSLHRARARLSRRLVEIYRSGEPSALDVLVGA